MGFWAEHLETKLWIPTMHQCINASKTSKTGLLKTLIDINGTK